MVMRRRLKYGIRVKSRTCELFVLTNNDFLKLSINFKDFIQRFLQKSLLIYLNCNNERKKMIASITETDKNDGDLSLCPDGLRI